MLIGLVDLVTRAIEALFCGTRTINSPIFSCGSLVSSPLTVSVTVRPAVIEIEEKRVRAVDRSSLFSPQIPLSIPKLLYYPIRQRAYPIVHEKGLYGSTSGEPFVLPSDRDFAERLGRRIDHHPVLLTINTNQAIEKGVDLKQFGTLFLADRIPTGCFSGPPLPKERPAPKKPDKKATPVKPRTPGSFYLDLTSEPPASGLSKRGKGKHKNNWKRDRKRINRKKGFR